MVLLVLSVSMSIRRAVLPLETDAVVNEQMAAARVDGSGNGETNDNACINHKYNAQEDTFGGIVAAHRGGTTQAGSA